MKEENLIQVIAYREFLNNTTGKMGIKQKHFEKIEVSSSLALLNNLEKIVGLIPENERYNVHYTNAACLPKTENRPLRSFYSQDIIVIDLDGIDLSKQDEYIDIVFNILKADKTKTGIYCSGNGIHIVVVQKESFDLKGLKELQPYYKEVCRLINADIYNAGLPGNADPIRLSESATLRLPLTENRKKDNITQSYIIQGNVKAQDFSLNKLVNITVSEEESNERSYPTDTPSVLSGCNFLKWCKENPNKVSEPQWYRMIQTLAYVPEIGESLCHTYSKDALSYDETTTQNKYEQARSFGKPATCDGINSLWNNCVECPYFKKVKTPLQIRSDSFIATEKTGFHTITQDSTGKIKLTPNYDDLISYYDKLHTFITNIDTHMLMKYDGKKWIPVEDLEITSFATNHFVPTAKNSMRAEFLGCIKNKKISCKGFVGKDNNNYINFYNGVLDIKTKELKPHSKEYGFTYCLPYPYNPEAKCPNFETMMSAVTLNDKELENVILEFVGLAISGRPNSWVQKVMVLSGEGSNGKSTFMNIIRKLVGEECYSAVSLASMAKENTRYSMLGKLFNISFDEDPKALLKGGVNVFKAISAGDPVDIRKLYSDPISAPINSKLIVACNKPLETNDHTHAVYRRMLIIPFRAKFEGTSDNKDIASSIDKEMSGIYNLVLNGLDRLIKNKGNFSNSITITNALEDYKYNSAIYVRFFEDTYELTEDRAHFKSIEEVMRDFDSWCVANNEKNMITSSMLMKELKSTGKLIGESETKFIKGVGNKRVYYGIKKHELF